jgi:hypothetical protein
VEDKGELVTATVTVPRERLGDLYRLVGGLNESGPLPTGSASAPGVRPWSEGDGDVAEQLYRTVSENARRILDELMEVGDGSIGGVELARRTGLEKGAYGVAGSLSSVGKAATKAGRELPYRAQANAAGGPGIYGMEPQIAELFKAAREARGGRA